MLPGRKLRVSHWLAVAALLHLSVLGAVSLQAPIASVHVAVGVPIEVEVATDDVSAPLARGKSPALAAVGAPPARATTEPAPAAMNRRPVPVMAPPLSHDAQFDPTATATEKQAAAEEGWSLRAEKSPDLLARGQVSIGRARPTDGDGTVWEAVPLPGSRTGGVAEALIAGDVANGLGRGGPVVVALEEAARVNDAPVRGVATFDVLVNRDGSADVHLDSADSEADAWSRLCGAMSDAVARHHVRVPDGAQALRVTVKLDAKVQFPDGRDPRTLGTYAETTGLKLAKDSMVAASVPGVTAGVRGKNCSVGIHAGLEGLAVGGPVQIVGGCSTDNIGAVPVRMIHGQEVGEVPMGAQHPSPSRI